MDSGGAANSSLPEFRRALIGWLDEHLTPELVGAARGGLDDPDQLEMLRAWNRVLADARWAVPAWPAEHGGRDATVDEQLAYLEVMAEKGAPGPVNVIGVANIAPAILEFGTQLQKDRFIAPLLRGDEIWCQGMSEPDAGSDLASLRTTARLVGDEFVVDGQKTWNSLGHLADWCQLYVRTDPEAPKHAGISCLLVDMRTPGIEVSPVRTMAGDRTFSELFFSEARIPSSALLGPLNDGWRVAMTTLSYERAGVAKFHLALTDRFNELLETTRKTGATVTPYYRDRLARVYAKIACLRWTTARELEAVGHGSPPRPAMGSMAKLLWSEISQEVADLAVGVLGPAALERPWSTTLLGSISSSIAGGTSEINRNIVGEHGLGLPR
ncbi:MAG: acyl-CoA dehydrogenase family protein [Acidimicrobiales bacterium]